MTDASGTFQVTGGGEDAYHEQEDGPKLARVTGSQRFTGDIEGEGSVEWLMCYAEDGTARFVGMQLVRGVIDGRKGSVVLETVGEFDGGKARGRWTVIPGSATGDLAGITGEGRFESPHGPNATYTLEVDLP